MIVVLLITRIAQCVKNGRVLLIDCFLVELGTIVEWVQHHRWTLARCCSSGIETTNNGIHAVFDKVCFDALKKAIEIILVIELKRFFAKDSFASFE